MHPEPLPSSPSSPTNEQRAIAAAILITLVVGGVMAVAMGIRGWQGWYGGKQFMGAIIGVLGGLGFGVGCGLAIMGVYWLSLLSRKIQIIFVPVVLIAYGIEVWLSGGWVSVPNLLIVLVLLGVIYLVVRQTKRFKPK